MPPLSKSSALSLLLTLSLLFPSVSLAIEGSLGGDADTSGYGGGTSDTSDTSTGAPGPEAPDYSGENNGADSPSETGPGPGVSAEEAAANDQAKADAQTAASYGMNGTVDTNATSYGRQNGTIDDDQVAMSDGTVQSLSQGKAAADAIANANNIGAPVDPTATHNMYQGNPNTPAGNVVSNGTYTKGISGPAATVAKAEIVAGNNVQASAKALASGYTSVVNGVKDIAGAVTAATNPAKSQTYQQGLAQSFYSGPKGVSVTTDNQSYVNSTLGSNTGLNTAAQNAASNAGKYSYDPNVTNKDGSTGGWTDQNGRSIESNPGISKDIADKVGSLTDGMKSANKDSVNYSATIDITKSTVTTKSINPASQTYGTTNTYDIKTGKSVGYTDPSINNTVAAPVGPANQFTPTNLGNYNTVTTKTTNVQSFVGKLADKLNHTAAASLLSDKVTLKDSSVSLNNVRSSTVATMNKVATDCNCNMTVTSVTDGKHAPGQYSHADGGKFDARSRDPATGQPTDLTNHMTNPDNGWSVTSHRSNGDPTYTNSTDPAYKDVTATLEDDHWDFQTKSDVTTSNVTFSSALTQQDSLFNNTPKGYEFGGDKTTNPGSVQISNNNQNPSDTDNDDVSNNSNINASYTNPGRTAGTIAGATIAGPIGAILGGLFGGWVSNQNWSSGGTQNNQEKHRGRNGNRTKNCPPYPLSCQAGAAILALPSLSAISEWWNGVWNTEVETIAEPEVESIQVLITVNNQTGEVEVNRPDVLASLSAPASYYQNEEQYDAMIKLLNETPILFGTDGEVVYSNGLYSPPVENGEALSGDIPEYLYTVEYLNENGELIAIDDNDSALPDNLATNVVRSVIGNATPFYTSDIASATYRLVEPNQDIVGDEYYDYVITLNDGTVKAITVPQFTSTAYMQKRFGELGFKGNAVDIISLATETKELPEQGLISRLFSFVSDQADKFMDVKQTDDTVTELPTIGTGVTAEDIEKVFIYPVTDISCPTDVEGYETGFMYTAIIKDRTASDYVYLVSDGRCGTGEPADLVIETARHLDIAYGVEGATYDSIVNKTFFLNELTHFEQEVVRVYRPVTTTTPVEVEDPVIEPATTTPEQKPNLTNDITLEVKAVGADGAVLSNWSPATKMTISSDVQLYFRWDGSSYQQCLPFLHDGGTYALTRQDRAMLRGNTESEGFNLTERTASYKIECGGQRNDEFGVDERVVEVVVE